MAKILAIDDINDNLISLKAIINDTFPGSIVFTALNGHKGIELAIAENPDVILLDIVMPDMDGFEVCHLLKQDERTRDIPVVFITALKSDKANRIKALEAGAEAFLTKPIDETELTAQIRAMVKIKAANEQKRNEKERLAQLVAARTHDLEQRQIEMIRLLDELKAENEARKKTESALRESEERFHSLFDLAPLGYQSLDEEGRFILINHEWIDTLGYTRDEVYGKWFGDFLAPEFVEAFRNRFPIFKALGKIHSEFVMMHKNGERRFIAFEGRIGHTLEGEFKQTHCILQDITERKKAEEQLCKSEEALKKTTTLLEQTFGQSSIPLVLVSMPDAVFQIINPACREFLGIDDEPSLVGTSLFDFETSFQDFDTTGNLGIISNLPLARALRGESTFNEERFIVRKNGTTRWELVNAAPIYDEHGEILAGYLIMNDITQRKLTEEKLKKSEAQFKDFFERVADAIFIADFESGIIIDANEAASRLLHLPHDEIVGIHQSELHPNNGSTETTDTFLLHKHQTQQKASTQPLENKVLRSDGTIVPVEILAAEVILNGKLCLIGTFRDITDRKRAEEELKKSLSLLNATLESTADGILVIDNKGKVTNFNRKFIEFWQIPESLINTHDDEKLITFILGQLNDPDSFIQKMNELYRNEEESSLDEIEFKDGQTFERYSQPQLIEGKIIGRVWSFRDITKQKYANEALKESEEKYRRMVDLLPDAIIIHSRGKIVFANAATFRLIGATSLDQLIEKPVIDFVHPEHRYQTIERIKKIYETGEPSGFAEEKFITFDNCVIDAEVIGIPISYMGKPAVQTILRDITQRKLADADLKESEERYRRFISQVSEGVYRFESDQPMDLSLSVENQIDYIYDHMLVAECNNAFVNMYGASDQIDLIGKSHLDFHGGRNNPVNRESLRKFIINGYTIEGEITEEMNASGHLLYFSNNSIGIIENNHLVRMWGTQVDITEKTRADMVQQVLYAISNAALSSIDMNELIALIHVQLGKLLVSTNFYIAFYDEHSGMLSTEFDQDEKDQIESWPAEKSITGYVIRHKKSILAKVSDVIKLQEAGEIEMVGTPSLIWLGVPMILNDKAIGAIVVQSYDNPEAFSEKDQLMLEFISDQISITIERKQAENAIREALIKAKESDRLKSAFLANMSHEIRTPLNSIIGFSDLLLDPYFDVDQHTEFAKIIKDNGNNLLVIISDIMDLSKIEAGQLEVKKQLFSVNLLMTEIQKEFSFKANGKGIEFLLNQSNLEEELLIETDKTKLRQVLVNLVTNAIKFTEKGLIEIGVKTIGNFLQFWLIDTGIGIPKDYHDTIFERFRQVETAHTRKYGGNGLGLPISRALVELLGGTIWMESEQGKGSTFFFTIPR